jgi:hypothetical protein
MNPTGLNNKCSIQVSLFALITPCSANAALLKLYTTKPHY